MIVDVTHRHLQEPYRGIFLQCFIDENPPFIPKKKVHVNKRRRKDYYAHEFDSDGCVLGDTTRYSFENNITLEVRRVFQKPMPGRLYRELGKSKNASQMREKIIHYDCTVIGFDELPDNIQLNVGEIYDEMIGSSPPYGRNYTPGGFTTKKVSDLNKLIAALEKISAFGLPEEYQASLSTDFSLQNIPYNFWIRRKDKAFIPEFDNIQDKIIAESRYFYFPNSLGLRVRRVFDEAMTRTTYESYKNKSKTALQNLKDQNGLNPLYLDPLNNVSHYDACPVCLRNPYRISVEERYAGRKLDPRYSISGLQQSSPTYYGQVGAIVGRHFGEDIQDSTKMIFRTADDIAISLCMQELAAMKPHPLAVTVKGFQEMQNEAVEQCAFEEQRQQAAASIAQHAPGLQF